MNSYGVMAILILFCALINFYVHGHAKTKKVRYISFTLIFVLVILELYFYVKVFLG